MVWGCANQAGEDNRNVGRMAVLLAGLPISVPAVTVNRLCGSSLDAAMQASRAIEAGDADGGAGRWGGVDDAGAVGAAEAVARVPGRQRHGGLDDAGVAAGQRADAGGVDGVAGRGQRAAGATGSRSRGSGRTSSPPARTTSPTRPGRRASTTTWWCRADGADLARDEGIRPGSSAEKLAGLKPSFRPDGTITAGNASPLNDGASALLLGSRGRRSPGLDPLARIAGRGTHALAPQDFGFAPVEAAEKALARAGISWADVAAVELNEAFAVQSLACVDAWKVDPEIVNAKGGAIAIGHPLGASGGRILGTLAHRLRESGDRWGVAAICIGVGQALAVVLENVA